MIGLIRKKHLPLQSFQMYDVLVQQQRQIDLYYVALVGGDAEYYDAVGCCVHNVLWNVG